MCMREIESVCASLIFIMFCFVFLSFLLVSLPSFSLLFIRNYDDGDDLVDDYYFDSEIVFL